MKLFKKRLYTGKDMLWMMYIADKKKRVKENAAN